MRTHSEYVLFLMFCERKALPKELAICFDSFFLCMHDLVLSYSNHPLSIDGISTTDGKSRSYQSSV